MFSPGDYSDSSMSQAPEPKQPAGSSDDGSPEPGGVVRAGEPPEPEQTARETGEGRRQRQVLTALLVLALVVVVYAARSLLAPIAAALLLSFLFRPAVRGLERWRIPPICSALLIVLALFLLISGPVLAVIQPAMAWIDDAPRYLEEIEQKFSAIETTDQEPPVAQKDQPVTSIEKQAPKIASPAAIPAKAKPPPNGFKRSAQAASERAEQAMAWITSNTMGPLVMQTRDTLATLVFALLLLFFFLASGDTFLRRVVTMLPQFHDKRHVVEMIHEIEAGISGYLITLTMINTVFAAVASGVFWALGVPQPLLWGLGAGLCNFVPYAGPIVFWLIFTPVCILVFDSPINALWPSLAFIAMNILEGYIISPHIYGRRMSLHPLVVFLGIAVCGWLWGVLGAFMAVPLLVSFNVLCRHVQALGPWGYLISGENEPLRVGTQPAGVSAGGGEGASTGPSAASAQGAVAK